MYENAQTLQIAAARIDPVSTSPFPPHSRIAMNAFKRLTLVLSAIVLASALGCAGTATKESTGEYVSDTWITTKVKAVLADDPLVKAREVNVETFKGDVQLSGFVSSYGAMEQAERLTRGVQGVTSVRNDMRIK
jgi:osmotically-inducible protein OsmY